MLHQQTLVLPTEKRVIDIVTEVPIVAILTDASTDFFILDINLCYLSLFSDSLFSSLKR